MEGHIIFEENLSPTLAKIFSFPHSQNPWDNPCYNPIKTYFFAVFITPVPFLFYLHTLCTHRS